MVVKLSHVMRLSWQRFYGNHLKGGVRFFLKDVVSRACDHFCGSYVTGYGIRFSLGEFKVWFPIPAYMYQILSLHCKIEFREVEIMVLS